MSPGDILAGVALASVPLWSIWAAVWSVLIGCAFVLLLGVVLVFGRRGEL